MLPELIPSDDETTRSVSVDLVRDLMASTRNPRFACKCEGFIDTYREGDDVIEFCSSLRDWRTGLGWSGYRLMRAGVLLDRLVAKMS